MFFQGLSRFRGIFISSTVMVLLFALFFLMSGSQQMRAKSYAEYLVALSSIYDSVRSHPNRKQSLAKMESLLSGGEFVTSDQSIYQYGPVGDYVPDGEKNISKAIDTFKQSDIKATLSHLDSFLLQATDRRDRSEKVLMMMKVAVILITILLYVSVVIQISLQMARSDQVEAQSKKETEGIMSTLSEGVFLLDKNYEIGAEQSASLKGMFKSSKDLEGNFLDFIGSYVTQSTIDLAQEFLDLLYGDRVKEKLIEELNPLKKIEVHIVRRDGSFESRYLDFKFKRVMNNEKVESLLGSVTDVTRQVMLERELEETKESQEAQLDMLKSILHLDKNKLKMFFDTANNILQEVNGILEKEGRNLSGDKGRVLLNGIGSRIHQIKGDAASLGLHRFEFSAHDLEEVIKNVQSGGGSISGKDLLPVTTGLRKMFGDMEDLTELVGKFSDLDISNKDKPNEPSSTSSSIVANAVEYGDTSVDILGSISTLSETVSVRHKKSVKLKTSGIFPHLIPSHLISTVQSILAQCVRNSIVHGIESPTDRLACGKDAVAEIRITFSGVAQGFVLSVSDNGQGADEADILNRAVEKGVIDAKEAQKLPKDQVKNLLFRSGFSTKDDSDADLDAGRGFGMDVVKRLVDESGGKVSLAFEKGNFFRVSVLFPVNSS